MSDLLLVLCNVDVYCMYYIICTLLIWHRVESKMLISASVDSTVVQWSASFEPFHVIEVSSTIQYIFSIGYCYYVIFNTVVGTHLLHDMESKKGAAHLWQEELCWGDWLFRWV